MLNKKQLQTRISNGLAAENAEDTMRRNARKDEISHTANLVQEALKKAGIVAAGWWHNNYGNGSGLSYMMRMSSVLPGQDVEIDIHKNPCNGIIGVDVKREGNGKKVERSFYFDHQRRSEAEKEQEVEDFQLYVSLMITEYFPDTKFSSIVFDYHGDRRRWKETK